jgi:hypothetical protein
MKRSLPIVVLLSLLLCACEGQSDAVATWFRGLVSDPKLSPIQLEWVIDTTGGSPGAEPAALERQAPAVVELLALAPKAVLHGWLVGANAATTDIAFTFEAPGSEKPSKASKAAYREALLKEFLPKLQQALQRLLQQPPPPVSPLFEAITVVGAHTTRQGYKKIIIFTSDLRDVTPSAGRFFECGPLPTDTDAFVTSLQEQALLKRDSLKGVPVLFTFVSIRPVAANACEQPTARWDRLQSLWRAAMTEAGATAQFFSRELAFNDLSSFTLAWMLVPIFGPGMFARRTYWSLWVWLTAWRDAAKRIYAPKDALFRRLQYYPKYDVRKNPTDHDMEAIFLEACERIEQLTDRMEKLLQRLAEKYPFWVLLSAVIVLICFETVGITVLVKDAGIEGSERLITGILVALGALFLTGVVWACAKQRAEAFKKKDQEALQRTKLLSWAVNGAYVLVVLALVIVRLHALVGSAGAGVADFALAIVLGLSVIGAPWMTKFFLEKLVELLPDQRRLWQVRKQLKAALGDRDKARAYKHRREGQRLFWMQEGSRLLAMYNIKHRHACKSDTDRHGDKIIYISDPDTVAADGIPDLEPLDPVPTWHASRTQGDYDATKN